MDVTRKLAANVFRKWLSPDEMADGRFLITLTIIHAPSKTVELLYLTVLLVKTASKCTW